MERLTDEQIAEAAAYWANSHPTQTIRDLAELQALRAENTRLRELVSELLNFVGEFADMAYDDPEDALPKVQEEAHKTRVKIRNALKPQQEGG